MNITSNSAEGDIFLHGIMQMREDRSNMQREFTSFVYSLGFSAWHIHDGWVMKNYRSIRDLMEANTLNWIHEHRGYSHSRTMPMVGDKIVLLEDSPDCERHSNPFEIWIFTVDKVDSPFSDHRFAISYLASKIIIYRNNRYEIAT